MYAKEKLYLTADRTRLVGDGDKAAPFLYAMIGDEIPGSAAEKFGLVDGALRRRPGKAEALLGSSLLPAMVAITATLSVQLGKVVARAHKDSGLTVDAWNALPEVEREDRLAQAVEVMNAEAVTPPAPKSKAAPRAKVVPKPKAAAGKEQKPAEDKEQKGGEDKGGGAGGGSDQGAAK